MITTIPLAALLGGWALAGGSPGPATLAISGTAMGQGRRAGLTIASGIVAGSASWGIAAALGVAALMQANAWAFEIIRYAGAAYLGYLGLKSLHRAWDGTPPKAAHVGRTGLFWKGALLHLTNPKAVLAWGSIYSIALPPSAAAQDIWTLFAMLISTSTLVFLGYGILFSTPTMANAYKRLHRIFDATFGLFFGAVAAKILTADLQN